MGGRCRTPTERPEGHTYCSDVSRKVRIYVPFLMTPDVTVAESGTTENNIKHEKLRKEIRNHKSI